MPSEERSWENYRANQERLKRIRPTRRALRREKGADNSISLIALATAIVLIAFLVKKLYLN